MMIILPNYLQKVGDHYLATSIFLGTHEQKNNKTLKAFSTESYTTSYENILFCFQQ